MRKLISEDTKQKLLFLAGNLPLVMVETHEKHFMTKEELDEIGYVGAEKLEDGRYVYKYPVQIAMNHYRRLANAYRKHGFEGCAKYIDEIKKLPTL